MKKIICIAITSIIGHLSIGQGIGVGTITPDPSAALDVSSVTQGMLVPRMTTAQRITISNAANGLLVYDITTETFWFYNDGWLELIDSAHREVYRSAPDKIYAGMTDKVGIGISNPLNKLDIDATANRSGSHASGRPLYITGDILGGSNGIEFRHSNGTQGIGFGFNMMYATGSNADQDLGLAAKGLIGNLVFQTNGLERMRITGSGSVGIGVNTPESSLDVGRSANYGTSMVVRGTTHWSHFNYGGDEHTYIRGGKAGSDIILNDLDGLGNIGVGTDIPLQKLHVEGNTYISQNLGIGTSSPNAQIQLASTVANRKVVLYEVANNDHQFFGFGVNPDGTLRYQTPVGVNDHAFYSAIDGTSSLELMRIKGNGNIGIGTSAPLQKLHVEGNSFISQNLGIGTSTPNAPIQLANSVANRKVVLYDNNNNDHQFYGLGINGNALRYQVDATVSDHVFYAATSSTTSNELLRIRGNGNVDVAGALEIGYTHQWGQAVNVPGLSTGSATCDCPAGTMPIGGGHQASGQYNFLNKSYANGNSGWFVEIYNNAVGDHTLWAFVICARVTN